MFKRPLDDFDAAVRCCSIISCVILVGTIGFFVIEKDWSLWQSLYFTLITITTVGYGDEGISSAGEKFAAFMLICGIGTFTYSLSALIQIAANYQAAMERKMQRQIDKMSGHIIVCGYGRIGHMICKEFQARPLPFDAGSCGPRTSAPG